MSRTSITMTTMTCTLAIASILTMAAGSRHATSPSGAVASLHCEIPCGIFDDHAEVQQMLLDAKTIAKASAQIKLLNEEPSAEHFNTMTRWVMVKEEHSRKIQHTIAWSFMAQRVKPVASSEPGYRLYLEKLVKHQAIMINAMKAAQSLDESAQQRLTSSIEAIAPWYPAEG